MSKFDAAWDVCEERSECDAHGSAEYRRVLADWHKRGHMLALLLFIKTEANRTPGPTAADPPTEKG